MGIRRVQTLEENKYRVFNRELAFYSDVKTGAFVDQWDNPMNLESPMRMRLIGMMASLRPLWH